jgi:hypothetical protein
MANVLRQFRQSLGPGHGAHRRSCPRLRRRCPLSPDAAPPTRMVLAAQVARSADCWDTRSESRVRPSRPGRSARRLVRRLGPRRWSADPADVRTDCHVLLLPGARGIPSHGGVPAQVASSRMPVGSSAAPAPPATHGPCPMAWMLLASNVIRPSGRWPPRPLPCLLGIRPKSRADAQVVQRRGQVGRHPGRSGPSTRVIARLSDRRTGPRRNRTLFPARSVARGVRTAGARTSWSPMKVPLRDPRSRTRHCPSTSVRTAWRRDTDGSQLS